MEYQCEVVINRPRQQVVDLMEDPDNFGEWQLGFQRMEHISGDPGQPGAKSKLIYDERGRTVEMIETVVERALPQSITLDYSVGGVENHNVNRFEALGPDQTRWVMECRFAFNGFMRVIAFFMRGAFPKRTQADMERFKAFVERQ